MKLPAYKLLKRIASVREMSLRDAKKLLSQQFGDFRDWYPVAGLIKQGYLANSLSGCDTEREIASMLFVRTLGEGHHKINNVAAINQADDKDSLLYATSKIDLYLAEQRAIRTDRLTSAAIAIFIGVSSALLTFYLKVWLDSAAAACAH